MFLGAKQGSSSDTNTLIVPDFLVKIRQKELCKTFYSSPRYKLKCEVHFQKTQTEKRPNPYPPGPPTDNNKIKAQGIKTK